MEKSLFGAHGAAFEARVFGTGERQALALAECLADPSARRCTHRAASAAADFAAKEAFLKAAGTGLLDAGEAGSPEVAQDAQEVSISPLWSQEENYSLIPAEVPKLRARRTGADHAEMLPWPDGYMTAWFMYWLQGDQTAGRAFFGPEAEILHNPLWQDLETNW